MEDVRLSRKQSDEFLTRLEKAGLTPELAARVIEDRSFDLAQEMVGVIEKYWLQKGVFVVNPKSGPISKLTALCGFSKKPPPRYSDEYYGRVRVEEKPVKVRLIHPQQKIEHDTIVEMLRAQNMQPAGLGVLLALVAEHRTNLPKGFNIVALSDMHKDEPITRHDIETILFPCVVRGSGKCTLEVGSRNIYDFTWDKDVLLLVIDPK